MRASVETGSIAWPCSGTHLSKYMCLRMACHVLEEESFARSLVQPLVCSPAACACQCRTMVTQLIEHERLETTLAKAKELRRFADMCVSLAKKVRHATCTTPATSGGTPLIPPHTRSRLIRGRRAQNAHAGHASVKTKGERDPAHRGGATQAAHSAQD
jgi:hypothetical protein